MAEKELLVRTALENGATKATVIPQEKIVMDKAFWDICASNGCGCFGKYWTCPPAIGEAEELMAKVRQYDFGVLYQTIGEIEDSFDIEGMHAAGAAHKRVSQKIHKAMRALADGRDFLHLSNGSCDLCARCAKLDNEPCRLPDMALPAMEGCCIDVYRTTKGTELKYINGANTVTYFGLVLFREENNA